MSVLDEYLVDPKVTLLDKTRIQAQVLAPVVRALRAELGKEAADALVRRSLRTILFGTSGSIRQTLRRGLASRPTFGDLGCSLKLWWLRPCHDHDRFFEGRAVPSTIRRTSSQASRRTSRTLNVQKAA
jgi:hypothetical protein